ncbi:MAG: hypothetical protein C4B58_15540 [Deltaproteobacteria bacterium]|nr:MAG: hypothetical protein C4B58_15540 [Deltaproteobacteria bacterium]
MAGGGVVSDVCLLIERKCQAFDIATRDNRPEIQYHHRDSQDNNWPITGKADLIFFDPPYYIKKEKAYGEKATGEAPSISSYSKEIYQKFIESFFILAHKNTGETTRIAFLNADWRDFESTPFGTSPKTQTLSQSTDGKEDVIRFFESIDWVMALSKELEQG